MHVRSGSRRRPIRTGTDTLPFQTLLCTPLLASRIRLDRLLGRPSTARKESRETRRSVTLPTKGHDLLPASAASARSDDRLTDNFVPVLEEGLVDLVELLLPDVDHGEFVEADAERLVDRIEQLLDTKAITCARSVSLSITWKQTVLGH
jgi:hypothetical protein